MVSSTSKPLSLWMCKYCIDNEKYGVWTIIWEFNILKTYIDEKWARQIAVSCVNCNHKSEIHRVTEKSFCKECSISKYLGQKFNNLTIIKLLWHIKENHRVLVKCICGEEFEVDKKNVVYWRTKECKNCNNFKS